MRPIRPIACTAILSLLLATGCARQKAYFHGGSPIDVKKPVAIAELSAHPEGFVGKTVRLEGTVSAVCQGSGCWAEVKAADGSTILARSMDHSILVPTDCVGRRIVVQGVVTELPAEVAAEPLPEDHECPRPTYLLSTLGLELY